MIFGATGATGKHLTNKALDAGHEVTVYARNPDKLESKNPNLLKIKAQLNESEKMEEAVRNKDAVFCALGSTSSLMSNDTTSSEGTKQIISAMKKAGVRRLIVLSSYGVGPGNRDLLPWFLKILIKKPLDDKEIQELAVKASGLDWTIVRPPQLIDKPAKNEWAVVD